MKKKILAIDDESGLLELLHTLLSCRGYDVITALDGKNGLEKAKSEKPDLIILDIMMPGMDGLEVLRKLRSDTETFDKTVIILTARGDTASLMRAQRLGSDDYIIKPVESQALLGLIEKYI